MALSKEVQSERDREEQPGQWEVRRVLERAERGCDNSGWGALGRRLSDLWSFIHLNKSSTTLSHCPTSLSTQTQQPFWRNSEKDFQPLLWSGVGGGGEQCEKERVTQTWPAVRTKTEGLPNARPLLVLQRAVLISLGTSGTWAFLPLLGDPGQLPVFMLFP